MPCIFSDAELIERRPGESDRRNVHVFLRPRGRALEKRVRPMVEAAYARLEHALTPADWRALYGALDRLIDVRTAEAAHASWSDALAESTAKTKGSMPPVPERTAAVSASSVSSRPLQSQLYARSSATMLFA